MTKNLFPSFRILVSVIIIVTLTISKINAQSMLDSLDSKETPAKEYVKNAFKSTRVISGQSIEHVGNGVLDFRILHRFGRVNTGEYGAYGLDQATIRLGLDYGITKRFMVGIGRSSSKKEIDAFAKYRLLWQSTGPKSMPLSVIVLGGVVKDGLKWADPDRDNHYSSRFAYYAQILVGRKFSEGFTFQIAPTIIHRNLVDSIKDNNDTYAIGLGTRLKLSRRIALTAEYFYSLPDQYPDSHTDPLSIGFDIETGGHVFQLHFTNAIGMNERALLVDTDGKWEKGDIHFGFNISRVFTLSKPKAFRHPDKS